MVSSRLLYLALMISVAISCASAIEINSPIENYHYDTENVLMNVTNNNSENSTACEFSFNIESEFNETINANGTYTQYFSSLSPTNILGYECDDSTNGSIVFYYEKSDSEESTMTDIFIVLVSFAVLCIILIFIFKF